MTTKHQALMVKAAVRRYLASGDYDAESHNWPGANYIEKEINHHAELKKALVAEVKRRSRGARHPALSKGFDLVSFTLARIAPMVEGLFPAAERDAVLGLLERSVVFLTSDNIERVLTDEYWLCTAWNLANLYLGSLGREGLDGSRSCILGLSQETTCFVSLTYFTEQDRFADFIVHEAAHIFHNWKREYAGMPHTSRREWLLEIDFRKRETFAWACEVHSRILALGSCSRERKQLAEEFSCGKGSPGEYVDRDELIDILREAAAARNGWKRILARCAPPRRPPGLPCQISSPSGMHPAPQ